MFKESKNTTTKEATAKQLKTSKTMQYVANFPTEDSKVSPVVTLNSPKPLKGTSKFIESLLSLLEILNFAKLFKDSSTYAPY